MQHSSDKRPESIRRRIGTPTPRLEDARLVTGLGRYSDDVDLPGCVHAHFVRSPHAHARIRSIDIAAALAQPGVIAVLTGVDVLRDGLGDLPCTAVASPPSGRTSFLPPYPALVHDVARYVGDRIAMVIAETKNQAKDAAELVAVDYEPLPAVTVVEDALDAAASVVWPQAHGNGCFHIERGDRAAVDAAFAGAAHVVAVTVRYPRIAGNPLEPRSSTGTWDASSGRYTLYTGNGQAHRMKDALASSVFKVPNTDMHVVVTDVGGGFGVRGAAYPEDVCVLWASRRLARPVRWTAERSEGLISDLHGRDRLDRGEAAFDRHGQLLAIRSRTVVNVGAYLNQSAGNPAANASRPCSVYHIPHLHVTVDGVFTNTGPVGVYRGTGKPENQLFLEKLMDQASRQLGVDPIELRRRNLVPAAAMPHKSAGGYTIDCGDFERLLDRALVLADLDSFAARRAESMGRGRLRGFGVGVYILPAASSLLSERMEIRVAPDGTLALYAGTQSTGQGHTTMYAMMLSDWLSVPLDSIRIFQGDTDRVLFGRGTFAERSATMGGSALRLAADDLIEKGKRFAAWMLEASPADIEFKEGRFGVVGTDRRLNLKEIARRCYGATDMPSELDVGLDGIGGYSGPGNFPNGCVVCEVEIDAETGAVSLERCTSVCDAGIVINPLTVTGQMHGSLCQAAGEMLTEQVWYDRDSGQLLSGSFMDYAMPRADLLPATIVTDYVEIPTASNPLGVKGGSESGNAGGPGAIYNAILDALAPLGVADIAIPATPERIWQAVRAASRLRSS